MALRYRKIYAHVWSDEKFVGLSPAAKLVALNVLTAQSNRAGVFAFSPALASEQTGLSLYVPPAGNVPPDVAGTWAERSGNVVGRFPQTFPEAFAELHVQRVASAFQGWLDGLRALAPAGERARIVLLTPGPMHETYFEQVFLARYLGITLVEGSDLTVRDRQVFLKTMQGLERVHVVLRRIDDENGPLTARQ